MVNINVGLFAKAEVQPLAAANEADSSMTIIQSEFLQVLLKKDNKCSTFQLRIGLQAVHYGSFGSCSWYHYSFWYLG